MIGMTMRQNPADAMNDKHFTTSWRLR